MNTDQFRGKKVAILGAGKEGLAMAEFLSRYGASVELRDQNPDLQATSYKLQAGESYLEGLDQFDLIVRSPGIPWLTPQIQGAHRKGIEVTSQTEIFLRHCPAKVIGVTGTKGKSTTAALITHLLEQAGKTVRYGGNNGESIIPWLIDLKQDDFVVLELSSFQLQGLSISPHVAVVLDITAEHLDHHQTVAEYVEAKKTIVAHQNTHDYAILNADSLASVEFAMATKAEVQWFSSRKYIDQGVHIKHQEHSNWLVAQNEAVETPIIRTDDLKLVGRHNWSNAAAAATVGLVLGVSLKHIATALQSFDGLPHRLQEISQAKGRIWIDDSYATAPDATIAALELYAGEPVVLIVGGSSKHTPFDELAKTILRHPPKTLITIGHTGPEIEQVVAEVAQKSHVTPPRCISGGSSMADIIQTALTHSDEGDVVLFSPACASFGLFKNAVDRAEQFDSAVAQLED